MPLEKIPSGTEVAKLEKEFKKKSLLETVISEYQTRKAPIRGYPNKMRGEVFRYERGQIVKAYKILRNQIRNAKAKGEEVTEKKKLLKEIRGRAKVFEKALDELNRQYYENVRYVEIETSYGKFSVPVVDLHLAKEGADGKEEDTKTPYFLLGTVATNYHQTAALSLGLALEGERVLSPAWPEQAMVGRPANFKEVLKEQQDLSLHKEYAKQILQSLKLEKVNLMGCSMGAAVALELAQDNDVQEIQDLVVIEPPGLERKSVTELFKDFVLEEGVTKTLPYSEARLKTLSQGGRENTSAPIFLLDNGRILANTYFDARQLSTTAQKGRYEVWVGTKSSVTDPRRAKRVFGKAQELREQQNPGASPIEIHVVEGGTHAWPFMNSIGFARVLKAERPQEPVTTTTLSELENSGMAAILKDMSKQ